MRQISVLQYVRAVRSSITAQKERMKVKVGIALIAAAIVSLAPVASASAEGTSIAGASSVTYGQQMFGNTPNGRKTLRAGRTSRGR